MTIPCHPRFVLASALLALVSAPPPATADRAGERCTSVEIQQPDTIVFQCQRGAIRARVQTNLAPGRYTIRYAANQGRFVVSPLKTRQAVITVSLEGDNALGERYQACVKSMRRGVPLVVVGARTRPTSQARAPKAPPTSTTPTTQPAPSATLASLTKEARTQPWTGYVAQLAKDKEQPLSASEVKRALQRRGIPDAPKVTSEQVVRDPAREAQWMALKQWERDLWNEFLAEYKGLLATSHNRPMN